MKGSQELILPRSPVMLESCNYGSDDGGLALIFQKIVPPFCHSGCRAVRQQFAGFAVALACFAVCQNDLILPVLPSLWRGLRSELLSHSLLQARSVRPGKR